MYKRECDTTVEVIAKLFTIMFLFCVAMSGLRGIEKLTTSMFETYRAEMTEYHDDTNGEDFGSGLNLENIRKANAAQ